MAAKKYDYSALRRRTAVRNMFPNEVTRYVDRAAKADTNKGRSHTIRKITGATSAKATAANRLAASRRRSAR